MCAGTPENCNHFLRGLLSTLWRRGRQLIVFFKLHTSKHDPLIEFLNRHSLDHLRMNHVQIVG